MTLLTKSLNNILAASNALYAQLPQFYPEYKTPIAYHKVSGLDIPFSPEWKNIGINLSGGADSASLCLILANIIKENNYNCKIHVITFLRCWSTRPWQEPVAVDVYEKLRSMFPDIIVSRNTNYIPPELEYGVIGPIINGRSVDQIEGSSFNAYISYKLNLDAVFNATSRNPRDVAFDNRMSERDKEPETGNIKNLLYITDNVMFAHPYRFVEKDWIISQLYIHDAVDLFELTRSCEGDIKLNPALAEVVPTPRSYTHPMYVPLCNECFWCKERSWALSKLEETLTEIKNINE